MTEKKLRSIIGISKTGLINSNHGLADIFGVKDDVVTMGLLSSGKIKKIPVKEFLETWNK